MAETELSALEDHLKEAHQRFLGAVETVRPDLHRYCSRMLGSAVDGEDAVQETLTQAYYKLSLLKQDVPLRAWLFRIAHNKCVDWLRLRRGESLPLDEAEDVPVETEDEAERRQLVGLALREVVETLPPKERTCLILKDVLDCSLQEIGAILDSPLTAVKAALHRARGKLKGQAPAASRREPEPVRLALIERYVALFNAQRWEELKLLLRDDVRLEVVGDFVAEGQDAIGTAYFYKYSQYAGWRLEIGRVDGEVMIIVWRREEPEEAEKPWSVVRIAWKEGQVAGLRDYILVPYLFDEAALEPLAP